ncbi:MAG: hypothetical protein K940chlam1_00361 [Candidatus Anoxychlamydiales bacterium]|nr:hypothetical protein [Candidatus Anoxychlamydiales bacterium]
MKRYIKLSVSFVLSLVIFAVFVAFVEKPEPQSSNKELIARRGRGGYRGGRRGRYRHGGGSGIYFRIDLSPSRRHYYREPYYDNVRVTCEVFDGKYEKVREVQIGGRTIYTDGSRGGRRYNFSLRPGYYTIRWRVSNEKYFGSKYRNYSRSLRIHRDSGEVYITIKGSSLSIR